MSKKWFFKRGNARLSWQTLPESVRFVAVDGSGVAYTYLTAPRMSEIAHWWWAGSHASELPVAAVGRKCQDWRDLLFERPAPAEQPQPLITAVEWAAIRTVFPGTRWVAKDRNLSVFCYGESPIKKDAEWWPRISLDLHRLRFLDARFVAVPWADSLTEYEGDE